ncbi:MAG: AAA family ATPase [Promethearchaeota archaeon]
MINIEGENIGGLRGQFKFTIQDGLSILHAPNGSGKSSLLRAFHLAIANKNISQDDLNNYLTEKEINGYVKINVDDTEYEVQIQRKGDKVIITYSNVDDEIFKFPSEELSFIRAKSDLFHGIINDDEDFISSWFYKVTEAHKYELFLEISTNILTDYKTARDDLKKKVSKDVSQNREEINNLQKETEKLSEKIESILDSEEYKLSMKEHSEKKDKIDKLRELIKNLTNKKIKLSDVIFKEEEAIENLKRELEDIKKRIDTYDANLPLMQEKLRKNEKRRDKLEVDLDKTKDLRLIAQQNLTSERKDLKEYEELINRETCPKCHQKLDPVHYKDLVAKGRAEVKKLEAQVKSLKAKEHEISLEMNEIEDELRDLTNFLKTNRESLNKDQINKDKDIKKKRETLPDKKNRRKQLADEIESKNKELLDIQEVLAEEIPLQNEIFKLQGELNGKNKLMNKLEEEIEMSSEYQLRYLKAEGYVKRAEAIHKYYSERFQHLTYETFKQINDALMASFELLKLAKLKKIVFDKKENKLFLEIQRANNVYTTLEKLSGAEKSLITLIITWVVKQMVLPDEPFFLVDEVTTEMDDTRFQDILNYISNKTDYVIVARHKPYKGKQENLAQNHIISTFA